MLNPMSALRSIGRPAPAEGQARPTFDQRLWFGVTGLFVVVLLGASFAALVSSFLTDRMLRREASVTREFLESVIRAEGTAGSLFAGTPETNPALGSFVNHIRGMPEILRANIYATDRQLLWSTDAALMGKHFGPNPELERALTGEFDVEIGNAAPDGKDEHMLLGSRAQGVFIEAYIPIRNDDRVIGVVELYKFPYALDAMLREGRRIIWVSTAAGMLLLFATLFWIVHRGARLIEGQQAELGRMEALAAVGQMAGAIAHSLRNPMAGIRNSAELLRLGVLTPPVVAGDVIRDVERLDAYVHDLLNYTRAGSVPLQLIEPAEVLRDTLARMRDPCERGGIAVHCDDTRTRPVKVRADPQLLGQALTSIITNAIEAMPGGGTLNVRIESARGFVTMAFADSGAGIPAEVLVRISEPFFTTKTRGLGLGLALTRRIVECFGGDITFQSPPGGGALVRVALPLPRG